MEINGKSLGEISLFVNGIALLAGKRIMEIYDNEKQWAVEVKHAPGNESPLTKADLEANRIIVDALSKEFPEIPVLTEEAVDDLKRLDSNLLWIIDPLDGTKDFLKKKGDFTVNIALIKDKKPILGTVCAPAKRELYYAFKGGGTFYQKEMDDVIEVQVSTRNDVSKMVIVKSRSHAKPLFAKFLEKHSFKEIKEHGSSLKGCKIAQGVIDVYPRFGPTNEWDIAAMHCVVEEAGGMMTLLDGSEINYNNEITLNQGFLISNAKMHGELINWCQEIIEENKE